MSARLVEKGEGRVFVDCICVFTRPLRGSVAQGSHRQTKRENKPNQSVSDLRRTTTRAQCGPGELGAVAVIDGEHGSGVFRGIVILRSDRTVEGAQRVVTTCWNPIIGIFLSPNFVLRQEKYPQYVVRGSDPIVYFNPFSPVIELCSFKKFRSFYDSKCSSY